MNETPQKKYHGSHYTVIDVHMILLLSLDWVGPDREGESGLGPEG